MVPHSLTHSAILRLGVTNRHHENGGNSRLHHRYGFLYEYLWLHQGGNLSPDLVKLSLASQTLSSNATRSEKGSGDIGRQILCLWGRGLIINFVKLRHSVPLPRFKNGRRKRQSTLISYWLLALWTRNQPTEPKSAQQTWEHSHSI